MDSRTLQYVVAVSDIIENLKYLKSRTPDNEIDGGGLQSQTSPFRAYSIIIFDFDDVKCQGKMKQ